MFYLILNKLIVIFTLLLNDFSGFSAIETWFIGTQSIILLAVLEYGVVLAMSMVWKPAMSDFKLMGKIVDVPGLFKIIDFSTFLVSLIIFVIFNISYWYL